LCTLHSNGAAEALRRLHTLVAEAQPSFPFDGIRRAVDVVLQLEGRGERRRLADIWRVPHGGTTEAAP
jgi:Flp pilus assembly CpaF family ATPase